MSVIPLAVKFLWRRIGAPLRKAQDGRLYADGWVGRRLKYELPIRARRIRISGMLPDVAPLRGQELNIFCNGILVKKHKLSCGPFELDVECPQNHDSPRTVLEISASRSFVPANIGYTQDYRILSYVIGKIEALHPNGNRAN
jgi:hypothetical protein